MALQAFDLNRAGDTAIPTLKVMEITPLNWHRFPAGVAPRPDPVWVRQQQANGGAVGDDVDTASATLLTDQIAANGPTLPVDYSPRDQQDRSDVLGMPIAKDVTRRRGAIAPQDPYPVAGDAPLAAPVVASLSPNTAPAAQLPLMVTITGTGFSRWSLVFTGGSAYPDKSAVYVNPTTMRVPVWAASPGTVSVAVWDHGVMSNANVLFTVT
jgi:hypothetical protein